MIVKWDFDVEKAKLMANEMGFKPEETENILRVKKELQDIIKNTQLFHFVHKFINGDDEEETVFEELSKGQQGPYVIAGGVISSLLRKEAYNDIDVFILKQSDKNNRHLLDLLMNDKPGKWTVRFNDKKYFNKETKMTAFNHVTKVQYILTEFQTRQALLKHFDYLHCTGSYVHGSWETLYLTKPTYDAIMNKHLIVNNPANVSSNRTLKFGNKGWRAPKISLLKPPVNLNPTPEDVLATFEV